MIEFLHHCASRSTSEDFRYVKIGIFLQLVVVSRKSFEEFVHRVYTRQLAKNILITIKFKNLNEYK